MIKRILLNFCGCDFNFLYKDHVFLSLTPFENVSPPLFPAIQWTLQIVKHRGTLQEFWVSKVNIRELLVVCSKRFCSPLGQTCRQISSSFVVTSHISVVFQDDGICEAVVTELIQNHRKWWINRCYTSSSMIVRMTDKSRCAYAKRKEEWSVWKRVNM